MKKRLLCLFLALIMVLGILPVTALAGEEEASHEAVCQDVLTGTGEEMAAGIEAFPEGFTLIPPAEGEERPAPADINDHTMSESEANGDPCIADRVYHDYTVSGYLSGTDLDYFEFTLDIESKVTIIAVAQYSSFMMGIYDSNDTLLVKDITGSYSGGYYGYTLSKTLSYGTYYLCLLDSAQKSQNIYTFYITIEPTHTHDYVETNTVLPTCGDDGYTEYTCSFCGHYRRVILFSTGDHDLVFAYKSVHCTEGGWSYYTCSVCNQTYCKDYVPGPGHDWGGASCTENRTCVVCGETRTASAHAWVNATCTTPKTCSECQTTEGEPLGHNWTDATCTNPKTCSICYTTEGEALGHSWSEGNCTKPKVCATCLVTEAAPGHNWTDATCTIPKTCSVCLETEGEALGHDYKATVTKPTCTAKGYTTHTCQRCKDSYTDTEVNATGHNWDSGKVTKAATCTDKGVKTFTCKNCKATRTEDIKALGHTEVVDKTVAPTCTKTGLTEGKHCKTCNKVLIAQKTVDATGHIYSDDLDATCNTCGETREVAVPTTSMYRLYNPNSGEHFYTGSTEERDILTKAGWVYEGIAWNATTTTGAPVYRLYNPNSGDHHYTMAQDEVDILVNLGWKYEGVGWNSASADNVPLYRLYNPNADCGSHHYTSSTEERDNLVSLGWVLEGIGWFGMLN